LESTDSTPTLTSMATPPTGAAPNRSFSTALWRPMLVVEIFCGLLGTALVTSRAPETSCVTTPWSPKMMSSSLPTVAKKAAAALPGPSP
jgi:hypothetical protein